MDHSKDKAILVDRPKKELDEPLNISDSLVNVSDLSPKERNAWQKWSTNMSFMKFIIFIMLIMYFIDAVANNWNSSLKEPIFEVLKIILFTVSGYVFAKNKDE